MLLSNSQSSTSSNGPVTSVLRLKGLILLHSCVLENALPGYFLYKSWHVSTQLKHPSPLLCLKSASLKSRSVVLPGRALPPAPPLLSVALDTSITTAPLPWEAQALITVLRERRALSKWLLKEQASSSRKFLAFPLPNSTSIPLWGLTHMVSVLAGIHWGYSLVIWPGSPRQQLWQSRKYW